MSVPLTLSWPRFIKRVPFSVTLRLGSKFGSRIRLRTQEFEYVGSLPVEGWERSLLGKGPRVRPRRPRPLWFSVFSTGPRPRGIDPYSEARDVSTVSTRSSVFVDVVRVALTTLAFGSPCRRDDLIQGRGVFSRPLSSTEGVSHRDSQCVLPCTFRFTTPVIFKFFSTDYFKERLFEDQEVRR